MNESLSRALIRAGLSVEDVAARLGVDTKTVCRWLEGRVPYRRYRWVLAALLGVGDLDLWPELRGQSIRPDDVVAVLPRRGDVAAGAWLELLGSA
jgi:transcriptional regulator with XRE-family HTH domain